MSRLLLIETNY